VNTVAFNGTGWYIVQETYYEVSGNIFFNATLSLDGEVKASWLSQIVYKNGVQATTADAFGLRYFWFCQPCDANDGLTAVIPNCQRARDIYIDDTSKFYGTVAPTTCSTCDGCCQTGCLGAAGCDLVELTVSLETSPQQVSNAVTLDLTENLAVKLDVTYGPGPGVDESTLETIQNIQCLVEWPTSLLHYASSLLGNCYFTTSNLSTSLSSAVCTFDLLVHPPGQGRYGLYSTKVMFEPIGSTGDSGNINVFCQTDSCGDLSTPAATLAVSLANTVTSTLADCTSTFVIAHDSQTQLALEQDGDLYVCKNQQGYFNDICSLVNAYDL